MSFCGHPKKKVYETENTIFEKCLIGHRSKKGGKVYPVFMISKKKKGKNNEYR